MDIPEWIFQNGYSRMDIPEWIFQNGESYIKSTTWKYRPRRTKVDGLALNVSCRGSSPKS